MSDIFHQLESNNKQDVEDAKQKILEQFANGDYQYFFADFLIYICSARFLAFEWVI